MTLPALPLFLYDLNLPLHQSLKLALCWLRGGNFTDYLALEVSDAVLMSMVLQAAADHSEMQRKIAHINAKSEGWSEGFSKGLEVK
jgi:hypothetical protein